MEIVIALLLQFAMNSRHRRAVKVTFSRSSGLFAVIRYNHMLSSPLSLLYFET